MASPPLRPISLRVRTSSVTAAHGSLSAALDQLITDAPAARINLPLITRDTDIVHARVVKTIWSPTRAG